MNSYYLKQGFIQLENQTYFIEPKKNSGKLSRKKRSVKYTEFESNPHVLYSYKSSEKNRYGFTLPEQIRPSKSFN